jgi:hypothetical protein
MSALSTQLALVERLLPGEGVALRSLAMRSERFRSLCEDYGLTMETLTLMEARSLSHDAERVAEYRRLAAELEAELLAAFREENQ